MGRLILLLLAFSIVRLGISQEDFSPPVRGNLQLTGTFGELRSNHFHMGIDIRGGMGVPIYSIGDGYVSRIKVEGGGYGQALYITHPNGYTSVYAHLDKLVDKLADYVKEEQYKTESFVQDLELEPGQFPLSRGERIGDMGTKGYSFGPHLHFEIRRTKGDLPVNPLAFGFMVADRRKPQLRELRLYQVTGRGDTETDQSFRLKPLGSGRYRVADDTIRTDAAAVGLAVKAYDQMDGLSNLNGIHELRMEVDDSLHFRFSFDAIPYRETRYSNAHLDYADQQANNSYYHRCFRLPGNLGTYYDPRANRGVLRLYPNRARQVKIYCRDFAGNTSEISFYLKRRKDSKAPVSKYSYNYILPYNEKSIIDNGELRLFVEDSSLYQDMYLLYDKVVDESSDIYSEVHHLASTDAIHRPFQIGIKPRSLPSHLKEKAFIARCDPGTKPVYYGGSWESDGRLHSQTNKLGDFCIMIDTIPPTIDAFDFSSDMRGWSKMRFKIRDNFSGSPLQYRATIDGQWILLEYDAKKSRLIHLFDEKIGKGEHLFRLEVEDGRGNVALFERKFRR